MASDLTPEEIASLRAEALSGSGRQRRPRKNLWLKLLDMAERCAKAEAKAAAYDKLCESQREQWSSITRDIVRAQNKQGDA